MCRSNVAILVQHAARYPVVVVDELLYRAGVVEPVVHPGHVRTTMSITACNERYREHKLAGAKSAVGISGPICHAPS